MKIRRGLYFLFAAASIITAIVSCLNARSLSDENKILKALAEQENKSNSKKQVPPIKQEIEIAEPTVKESQNTEPENPESDIAVSAENETEIAEPEDTQIELTDSPENEIKITETTDIVNKNHETEITETDIPESDSTESDTRKNENEISAISNDQQTDSSSIGNNHGKYVIIINKKTKKYHTGKCRAAQNTSSVNRLEYHVETFGGSEEDHRFLESLGYIRCGICK